MEDDDLFFQHSISSRDTPPSQLAIKQVGRKSTSSTSRDRSIDREEPPIFARKSSVALPHSTAGRKVITTSQHSVSPVLRFKNVRHPSASSDQNTSIRPPIATSNVRRTTISNVLSPLVQRELSSIPTLQHPGSQASPLNLRACLKFKC